MVFTNRSQILASEIASVGDGDLVGPDVSVRGFDKIDRIRYRSPIVTYALSSKFLARALKDPWIAAIVVSPKLFGQLGANEKQQKSFVLHEDPESFFFSMHNHLVANSSLYRAVHRGPAIGEGTLVHPSAVVERGARIGRNVSIGANVLVGANSVIGDDCIIMPGVTVGAEALEIKNVWGKRVQICHVGGVRLGKGVVLAPNSLVSKSVFHGETIIGDEANIGEYSHISHGVKVGKRAFLASGVLTGGYSEIGDDAYVGMGAMILQFVKIGARARVSMASSVVENVEADSSVSGVYAKGSREWAAEQLFLRKLSSKSVNQNQADKARYAAERR